LPGVKNFFQVTTNLYRGAQPDAKGMAQLKAMGIKTIVNLRAHHSDEDEIGTTALKAERFRTSPRHGEVADVIGFLKIIADTNNLPVFVHCQRGADRTGMMCAMYRGTVCGWTKEAAIDEMKNGGFNFYPGWKNLIDLIEKTDAEDLRRRAGFNKTTTLEASNR